MSALSSWKRGGKPDSMKGSGRGGLGLPHRRDPRTDRDRAMAMPAGAGSHRREYQHYYGESTDMVSEEYWSSDGAWGAWREWEQEAAGLEEGGWAPPPAPASSFGDLERRIDTMSQEFTDNLRRISEKDEKQPILGISGCWDLKQSCTGRPVQAFCDVEGDSRGVQRTR
eukprot:s8425_g1.t1